MLNTNSSLGDSLDNRVISALPLSIATSLALESVFNPQLKPYDSKREAPDRIDISKYQEMWFNLWTLFRNISSAVNKPVFLHANEAELKDVLAFELEVIDSLFRNEGNGFCKPIYYFCNYIDLYTGHAGKNIKLRQDKTDFQKTFKYKLVSAIKLLIKDRPDIIQLNTVIKPVHKTKALMLSHVPHDLTNYPHFSKLDLIESNTGKLKHRSAWYTKYYPVGDRDLSHIPFNKKLLYVFGDRVLIQPSDIKLRRMIVDIADKRNWSPMVTVDKIIQDFTLEIKEPFVLKYLKEL